jgi:hypothetical protein
MSADMAASVAALPRPNAVICVAPRMTGHG